MSNVYQLEPPTVGKVVLVTSLGDIEIELWPKEAPKACRNFVQLCLERYYDNTIFHRVIKDFMIQGGDPTGTGTGGESVFGEPFKDEFHSRLHFNHRGQVAMANSKPNDNGSQFFITLDKSPWLERKHTIFGKVTGTTIYNALKIGELEVEEGTDRPMEPPTIQRVDVVWNPFEDIKPRNMKPLPSEVVVGGEGDEGAQAGRKRKNLALLSFGDEAEEDEEAIAAAPRARVKSIHDAVDDDARLVKAGTSAEAELRAKEEEAWERERAAREVRAKLAGPARGAAATEGGDADPEGEETFEAVMRKRIMDKRRELGHTERAVLPPGADAPEDDARRAEKEARRQEKEARKKEKEEREASRRAREAERLKRMGMTKAAAEIDAGLYNAGEVKRREIKSKKAATAEREAETLAKLARFQAALGSKLGASAAPASREADPEAPAARDGAVGITRFRAEGLYYADEDDEDEGGGWAKHALKFVKTVDSKTFAPTVDDYVVFDPLLEKGKAAFKAKQQRREK